ncbi:hypothetical protein SCP_0313070 [Sparassis crispa]|uniref:Uncharacterized protein n=1 Tax=Sparassis crispa TaxID=139825 RepID=A0A401GHD9_9APHY|nr:hypothetical protein SCP_0313070 [Sparassis crispa]GBE81578.1 hypothetical protein SCP_0313070 [Sparassis crispa]
MTAMDAVLSKLRRRAREHPHNKQLQELLSRLSQLQSHTGQSDFNPDDWNVLKDYFDRLTSEGIWDPREGESLLDDLRTNLHSRQYRPSDADATDLHTPPSFTEAARSELGAAERISIVMPPPISTPLLPISAINTTVLPMELVDTLNQVYFLHLLATDPDSVLPPGKSLLSVMSRPLQSATQGQLPSLQERVETLVHKAFWDEALEALASPVPSVEVPRLERLYEDLYDALKPLLPSEHPILIMLSSPLSPTSSPLRSAIAHLRETLACLRERCAPARDAHIDSLILRLDDVSSIMASAGMAKLVVDTVRAMLKLAEDMKGDLSQFVLGTMGEAQLRAIVTAEAHERERALVLELWPPPRVHELWQQWCVRPLPPDFEAVAEHAPHAAWIAQLVHALGSTVPVSCPMPTVPLPSSSPPEQEPPRENVLPPPLFFVCPTLLYIQNVLQALIIAASLRSLVRLPSSQTTLATEFTTRIWALLKAEVDEEPGAGATKLVNLADEAVRVRRLLSEGESVDADEEARLRAAVDRTLQPHDPVFILLQKRLLHAIAARLCAPPPSREKTAALPERLQAGRGQAGTRPRIDFRVDHAGATQDENSFQESPLIAKGFEDQVLVRVVGDALTKLRSCVEWTEQTWKDLIENEVSATAA